MDRIISVVGRDLKEKTLDQLTPTEFQVLKLIGQGKSNDEIAETPLHQQEHGPLPYQEHLRQARHAQPAPVGALCHQFGPLLTSKEKVRDMKKTPPQKKATAERRQKGPVRRRDQPPQGMAFRPSPAGRRSKASSPMGRNSRKRRSSRTSARAAPISAWTPAWWSDPSST